MKTQIEYNRIFDELKDRCFNQLYKDICKISKGFYGSEVFSMLLLNSLKSNMYIHLAEKFDFQLYHQLVNGSVMNYLKRKGESIDDGLNWVLYK